MVIQKLTETSFNKKAIPVYRKILIPLDGSELAEQSLTHALGIIKDELSTIILLSVVQPFNLGFICAPGTGRGLGTGELLYNLSVKSQEEAREYLDGITARLKNGKFKLQNALRIGRAAEEIVQFAESNKIDLIIMSTHGRSGLSRWVLGSVTDQVVRASMIPVLVIPPEPAH